MARLSRTEKYAELRGKISQDREKTLESANINHYEDKLKKLESFFNSDSDINQLGKSTNFIPAAPTYEEKQKEKEREEEKAVQQENIKFLDDILGSIMSSFDLNKEEINNITQKENNPVFMSKDERDKFKAEELARHQYEEELKAKEEELARKQAEEKLRLEKEAEERAEAEARARIEAEAKLKAEQEAREKAEQEAREKAEAEEKAKAEAKAKEELEAKAKAEAAVKPHNYENIVGIIKDEVDQIGTIIDSVNNEYGIPAPIKNIALEEAKKEEKIDESKENNKQIEVVEEAKSEFKQEDKIEESQAEDKQEVTSNVIDNISKEINDYTSNLTSAIASAIDSIKHKEKAKEDIKDFVNKTIDEVNDFNKASGKTTLLDLPSALIDEVRHNQEVKEELNMGEALANQDFSNTVSIEINKVLEEIKNQRVDATANIELPTAVFNPIKEEDTKEAFENAKVEYEPEAQAEKDEGPVVEIKNITETLNTKVIGNDVLDDTIPFTVNKEQEVEDEDDEEESTSPVLNIILGVLIFVLVAVLAVIIYYILVARGIIE